MALLYAAFLFGLLAMGLGLLIGRRLAVADLGPEVGSAHFKRRLPLVIAVVGGVLLFSAGVFFLSHRRLALLTESMFLLLSVLAWGILIIVLLRRQSFGRSLLRLPRARANWLWAVFGGSFLVLGSLQLLLVGPDLMQGFGWISLGVLLGTFSLIAFEVREGGIAIFDSAVPWRRIRSYAWEGHARDVLALEVSGRPRFFRTIRYKVPPQYREKLSLILRDKVVD